MKLRSLYLKVTDMEAEKSFWQNFLGRSMTVKSKRWCECKIGEVRFALLLNDFGDTFANSSCVPVFEYSQVELPHYIDKALSLGATVAVDGLKDPDMQSIILNDPEGHEFELTRLHD